jgi:hypothetical protein
MRRRVGRALLPPVWLEPQSVEPMLVAVRTEAPIKPCQGKIVSRKTFACGTRLRANWQKVMLS